MLLRVLVVVEATDGPLQVLKLLLEIFLRDFHFLGEFVFKLFNLPLPLVDKLLDFPRACKDVPSPLHILFRELVVKILEYLEDVEDLVHLNFCLVYLKGNV
jgi:hypothetical protein